MLFQSTSLFAPMNKYLTNGDSVERGLFSVFKISVAACVSVNVFPIRLSEPTLTKTRLSIFSQSLVLKKQKMKAYSHLLPILVEEGVDLFVPPMSLTQGDTERTCSHPVR